jgi:hypothetical protein
LMDITERLEKWLKDSFNANARDLAYHVTKRRDIL